MINLPSRTLPVDLSKCAHHPGQTLEKWALPFCVSTVDGNQLVVMLLDCLITVEEIALSAGLSDNWKKLPCQLDCIL